MKTSGKILNDTNQSKYDYIMARINEAKQHNQKRVTIKLEQMSKPVIKLLMENGYDVYEERAQYKKREKRNILILSGAMKFHGNRHKKIERVHMVIFTVFSLMGVCIRTRGLV